MNTSKSRSTRTWQWHPPWTRHPQLSNPRKHHDTDGLHAVAYYGFMPVL